MLRPCRVALIGETGGLHIRYSDLPLDLAQQERTAIRGQGATIEPGIDIEPVDG